MIPIAWHSLCIAYAIPDWLYGVSSVVWFRVLPTFSFLGVFAAFLAFAPGAPGIRRRWWVVAAGMVLIGGGLGWEVRELTKLRAYGHRSVNTLEQTQAFYRPDSTVPHILATTICPGRATPSMASRIITSRAASFGPRTSG